MRDCFEEEYLVKINYQKPDGYWKVGHIESVCVKVKHGVNERANHEEAAKLMKEK